jgi:hypothetical protein
MLDVFIRAGSPQQRSVNLESIRDAEPLHFGLDLESFGQDDGRRVNLTEYTSAGWATVDSALYDTDQIAVEVSESAGDRGWWPTQADIGRYIQIVDSADPANPNPALTAGTFKITAVQGRYGGNTYPGVVLVTVSLTNYDRPGHTEVALADGSYQYKVREEISIKDLVRDRDGSRVLAGAYEAGADLESGVGAKIGDSLIIEAGDDAGIYTIRRILGYAKSGDTALISQELSRTVTPSGSGDRSGLRYRVADELDIDLIHPRTTKIPLGNIYRGDDLKTEAGSPTITGQDTTNFALAGVLEEDIVEIKTGPSAGKYVVKSVSGSNAEVEPSPLSTSFNEEFEVYTEFSAVERPLVRVKEVELLDASQQGTGIKIPYGDIVDARVLNRVADQGKSVLVESWDGKSGTAPYTFSDASVDFEKWGVATGHRLSIKSGLNTGEYVIESVSGPNIVVKPTTEGGADPFATPDPTFTIHYTVGQPSVGVVRLYFLTPTTVSIGTGQYGGRVKYTEGEVEKGYFFTEVEGRYILPAAGSGDTLPRGIRPARQFDIGGPGGDRTVFVLPDSVADAYRLELQVGDYAEVNEQIPWRTSDVNADFVVPNAGDPGLLTLAGSDLVRVPGTTASAETQGSGIDFLKMDDNEGLVGQMLIIDESAPDAGVYTVEEVVDRRTLRLNTSMSTTTENSRGSGSNVGVLSVPVSGGGVYLSDASINPVGFARAGDFVTVYEVRDPAQSELAGTYEILSIDFTNNRIRLDMAESKVTGIAGPAPSSVGGSNEFRWMTSDGETNVFQKFFIYQASPARGIVTKVSPVEDELTPGGADWGSLSVVGGKVVKMTPHGGVPVTVKVGDIIEATVGPNSGSYEIRDIDSGGFYLVYDENPFSVVETTVPYRLWGGVHGSPKVVEVGPDPRDSNPNAGRIGRYDHAVTDSYGIGRNMPFAIRRRGQYRVCSTDMVENFDGTLYYVDVNVESLGNGDGYNLEEGTRVTVESGMDVDGYTHIVDNSVLTFSPYEEVSLKFDRRFLPEGNSDLPENLTEITARNLKISYDMSPTVRVVNDLVRSDTDRPINANPIARHMLPSYVFSRIRYQGGSAKSVVGKDMEDYINSLGPTDELEVSDLEAFATRRGATYVEHPIELVSVTHDLDRKLVVERSEDKIGGTTVPYNGTSRISSFFAKLSEGLDVDRE